MPDGNREDGTVREFHWAWGFALVPYPAWKWFLWVGGHVHRYGEETMYGVFLAGFAVIVAFTLFLIVCDLRGRRRARQVGPMTAAEAAGFNSR